MIPCPACKGHNVRGRRIGRHHWSKLVGRAIFRRHRCRECGHNFVTFQAVVDAETADTALDLVEPAA